MVTGVVLVRWLHSHNVHGYLNTSIGQPGSTPMLPLFLWLTFYAAILEANRKIIGLCKNCLMWSHCMDVSVELQWAALEGSGCSCRGLSVLSAVHEVHTGESHWDWVQRMGTGLAFPLLCELCVLPKFPVFLEVVARQCFCPVHFFQCCGMTLCCVCYPCIKAISNVSTALWAFKGQTPHWAWSLWIPTGRTRQSASQVLK